MIRMSSPTTPKALARIVGEIDATASRVAADEASLRGAVELTEAADRVFVHGAGRSGLALRMTAMRLMHLGLDVHVVGETTTPAIREGDVLIAASGSGTTSGVVRAAEIATAAGARVLAITTDPGSRLSQLATVHVTVPAAAKTDRSEQSSSQYAGSLFEQVLVLLGDALFDVLWRRDGASADELWPRHANLE